MLSSVKGRGGENACGLLQQLSFRLFLLALPLYLLSSAKTLKKDSTKHQSLAYVYDNFHLKKYRHLGCPKGR